jgi:DNA mismatch endonuclease (patch repair protein)
VVDVLTPEQRSRAMRSVKSKDTSLERSLASALSAFGYRFKKHVGSLPGRPDVVFVTEKIAVFVDGEFWHGYRYPSWRHKLTPWWRRKIEENRARDKRNFAKLRRWGWIVVRIWGREIHQDTAAAARRVTAMVDYRRRKMHGPRTRQSRRTSKKSYK